MWPVGFTGFSKVPITCCPGVSGARSARFSAIVLPVTVMQSPCSIPFSNIYLRTPGVPPTSCRSDITYFPLGFRSAMNGVLADSRRKSSRLRSTPAERAIAIRWMVAFVEPPAAGGAG